MSLWQKCPVCDGTGLVSKPPGIAGDCNTWTDTNAGPYTCRVCLGAGIILAPISLDPTPTGKEGENG